MIRRRLFRDNDGGKKSERERLFEGRHFERSDKRGVSGAREPIAIGSLTLYTLQVYAYMAEM